MVYVVCDGYGSSGKIGDTSVGCGCIEVVIEDWCICVVEGFIVIVVIGVFVFVFREAAVLYVSWLVVGVWMCVSVCVCECMCVCVCVCVFCYAHSVVWAT